MDVTEMEPLDPADPLIELPNCLIMPHIASASVTTRLKMASVSVDNLIAGQLRELRVMGDAGVEALRWSSNAMPLRSGAVQVPQARISGEGEISLTWDAGAHPLVMVRDAATGEVLSFAKGGALVLKTRAKNLELTLSSGVASERLSLKLSE